MKHTETPWKVNLARSNDFLLAITTADETGNVALVHRAPSDATANANAAFIVQAVNAHADLLQALKSIAELSQAQIESGMQTVGAMEGCISLIRDEARAALANTQGVDK